MFRQSHFGRVGAEFDGKGERLCGGVGFGDGLVHHSTESEGIALTADLDAARKRERFPAVRLLGEAQYSVHVNGAELP